MHSICVLSYQRPGFLQTCIESLLRNADEPVELIVHDDGSTDPDVRRYLYGLHEAGMVSLLMLSSIGHNQGQGIALNRMFNAAKGDVIWKVDQDLIFQPNWLRDARAILDENTPESHRGEPLIGLLGGFHYWLDPCDSRKTMIEQFDGWSTRTHILGSCFAVTRDCWREIGPFEERWESFGEDWDFQKRVTASEHFNCALPDTDIVVNQGFGIGPSTVVVMGDSGPEPSKIKLTPYTVEYE